MAYKVFTNGSVLQASEINDNLMTQATAVFSNAAARTAAITSPVEGQLTYLEDTNQYASWNGSSWASPFGQTFIVAQAIGTGVSTINVTNVFSSDFDNYQIIISGANSSADDADIRIKFNNSTGSTYNYAGRIFSYAGTDVSSTAATQSSGINIGLTGSQNNSTAKCQVFSPFLTKNTSVTSQGSGQNFGSVFSGQDKNSVSHTGFSITLSGGTLTGGFIYVYGFRKD